MSAWLHTAGPDPPLCLEWTVLRCLIPVLPYMGLANVQLADLLTTGKGLQHGPFNNLKCLYSLLGADPLGAAGMDQGTAAKEEGKTYLGFWGGPQV
jgi:hypothetical protein